MNDAAFHIGSISSGPERAAPLFLDPDNFATGHYVLGKSGSGKSTYLEHLIAQDMAAGRGLTVMDFHGDLKERVLSLVPRRRTNDVVYIDPTDETAVIGLNILSGLRGDALKRELYVDALLQVFLTLWGPDAKNASWGPRLQGILKNALQALVCTPGATVLGVKRMVTSSLHHSGLSYRDHVLSHVRDPAVLDFWRGEDGFENWPRDLRISAIQAVLNKWQELISHPGVRRILAQNRSSIDLRQAVADRRIIIVNLTKGEIGTSAARLFASLLATKFFHEVMAGADQAAADRTPHRLYIDEFQNLETSALTAMLSEARKFKLSLVLAHQYTEQIDPSVVAAVFGNIKCVSLFSVGGRDLAALERDLAQVMLHIKENDPDQLVYDGPADFETSVREARRRLSRLEDHHCLTWWREDGERMLAEVATRPPLAAGPSTRAQRVVDRSRSRYGRDVDLIDREIARFLAPSEPTTQAASLRPVRVAPPRHGTIR